MTKEQLEDLSFMTSAFYIYGTITYKDAFDKPHYTDFCAYFIMIPKSPRALGLSNYCKTHNDSD